jgi:hypothetical protein
MDGMLDVLRPINASIHVALHAGWDGARLWPIFLLLSLAFAFSLVSLSISPVFDSVYTPSKWNICPLRALFDYESQSHLSSTAAIAASNKNNFHD